MPGVAMRAPPSPLRLALRCSGRVHRGSDATVVGSRRDVADSLRWCSALSSGRSVEFAGAPLPAAPAVEELEGCCSARRADSQAIATSRPTVVATATRRARPCCLSRQIDMNAVKRRLRETGPARSRPCADITGDGEVTPSSRPAAAVGPCLCPSGHSTPGHWQPHSGEQAPQPLLERAFS